MTRITRVFGPKPWTIDPIVIPAATETTKCAGPMNGTKLCEHLAHALRLDGQNDDIALLDHSLARLEDSDSGLGGQ